MYVCMEEEEETQESISIMVVILAGHVGWDESVMLLMINCVWVRSSLQKPHPCVLLVAGLDRMHGKLHVGSGLWEM